MEWAWHIHHIPISITSPSRNCLPVAVCSDMFICLLLKPFATPDHDSDKLAASAAQVEGTQTSAKTWTFSDGLLIDFCRLVSCCCAVCCPGCTWHQ